MIKVLYFISTILFLIFASSFHNVEQKVSVTEKFPSIVSPGEEFTITINVSKASVEGIGSIQQILPEGFNAEKIETSGGEFSFLDQKVKFNWLQLPAGENFSVSYRIHSDVVTTGLKIINGEFVYFDEGRTIRYPLPVVQIEIIAPMAKRDESPHVTRRLVCMSQLKGEYRVELTIEPNNNTDQAVFTDEIPSNFTAELLESHGADFTFKNHTAGFEWKQFPKDSAFTVSYLVRSGMPGASPVINGELIYGESNSPSAISEEPASHEISKNLSTTLADAKTIRNPSTNLKQDFIPPSVHNGVTYKVQISATQKSGVRNTEWFRRNYHVNANVEMTYHEGWKKYLIGNFHRYTEASEFKNETRKSIPGAFVVAYENGMRIPVSKALQNQSINQ